MQRELLSSNVRGLSRIEQLKVTEQSPVTPVLVDLRDADVLLPLLHAMEERAGERRCVFSMAALSGSLPARSLRGEREWKCAKLSPRIHGSGEGYPDPDEL
jgi:hypothetical protein